MVMDSHLGGYCNPTNRIKLSNETGSILLDSDLVNRLKVADTFTDQNFVTTPPLPSDPNPYNNSSVPSSEVDPREDYDFSDVVLKYISQMLMEEDMEDKVCMFQESAALQVAEKSFYDVIGEKYPPSPDHLLKTHPVQNPEILDGNFIRHYINSSDSVTSTSKMSCPIYNYDIGEHESSHVLNVPLDHGSQSASHSSLSSSSSSGIVADGPLDSPVSTLGIPDLFSDSQSIMQFKKGLEEASKFLPNGNGLFGDLGFNGLLLKDTKDETKNKDVEVKMEKYESQHLPEGSRGRKNAYSVDLEEGRSNKQSALYTESTVRSEMFDMVLLCSEGKNDSALRKSLLNGATKPVAQNGPSKGSNVGKVYGKKQGGKRNVVDLRTLLTLCAQSVAADDKRTANELLKQIRQHSSPTGDGMQRLAHYFADGLEARMAGSGTQIYKALTGLSISATNILKAYHLYLATCPFRKMSNFFSNKTIMNVAETATRLHIVDFGILYGFQWPCLIQRLSSRPGGPPKLRITGIDFPNPGFRPRERVEETGHRLANYAETFRVPFEFNAIAQKWETIQIEDLKIEKDEVLVVNCLFRFRNLLDETVMVDSPRSMVLRLIRTMKPDVFIQGIVNGAYNAPFFITRFREALFHFSSLFDMLESIIPRDIHERMLIEKTIFGQEAKNVIACEAAERIERPETYKQWQARNLRAGFCQIPLNKETTTMATDRVKLCYHPDFLIDEDGHWLLQGWKGRIIYALSSWRPAY